VVGIPGDVFVEQWLHDKHLNKIRLAKELVKFNERCFIRLLGDMRSYNFVVDVTPDFEDIQIRIRAMDFDQQSYSGRIKFYLPQFFKDNIALVEFCINQLNVPTARQYQKEEQSVIFRRVQLAEARVNNLLNSMCQDKISSDEKVFELRQGLAEHYKDDDFLKCNRMGEIVKQSLIHLKSNVEKYRSRVQDTLVDSH
jgi:hypothetical protein